MQAISISCIVLPPDRSILWFKLTFRMLYIDYTPLGGLTIGGRLRATMLYA